jgi:MinD superfamily P-loop ATPase
MKEIVIVSGKGGAGKTSLAASLAALAGPVVLADCDVDAADLPLLLSPRVRRQEQFKSGREAVIRTADCIACGVCREECRFHAVHFIRWNGRKPAFTIDPLACEGCGVCVLLCPEHSIDFPERVCGEWFVSETRFGPMVHAQRAIGAENSGKLASIVRKEARRIAEASRSPWMIVDGPPGMASPFIASIAGASLALIVIEPTLSGAQDMKRVLELTAHFGIPAMLCVNKWDLNPQLADQIEDRAVSAGAIPAGRIRYDRSVADAQTKEVTIVEYGGPAAEDIRKIWRTIEEKWGALRAPAFMRV